MSEHTKEPWDWCVFSSFGRLSVPDSPNDVHGYVAIIKQGEKKEIASLDFFRDSNTTLANARRIVACVNACAGVSTDALEGAGECAEHGVIPTLAAQYKADADALLFAAERAYETLIQERNNVPFKSRPYSTEETITILRKSIAKARGIS